MQIEANFRNFIIGFHFTARGRKAKAAFSRPRSQFFSLNGPTSRAITNIALSSEIKKQGRVTSPIIISFYSGAERCKNKTWISMIAAEKKIIPQYKKLM